MPPAERVAGLRRPTSPTARTREFGFDYLRDNLAVRLDGRVQRGHYFAIVDEADSILIDEARTPLIISGQPEEAAETYYTFAEDRAHAERPRRLRGRREAQDRRPTEEGVHKVEKALGIENLYAPDNGQLVNHLIQSLKAESLYKRDVEYVVQDGAASRSSTSSPAASWKAAAGRRACTRPSRPRRACRSRPRTSRSRRSRSRTTSGSTRSSPA